MSWHLHPAAFTCPERLDSKNLYTCENCQSSVRAHKQLSVFHAPNLLCIQLKRFRLGVAGKVGGSAAGGTADKCR